MNKLERSGTVMQAGGRNQKEHRLDRSNPVECRGQNIKKEENDMWISRWYWESQIRQRDELERRVKRLELIVLKDAESKIANLKDKEVGTIKNDGISTIEEVVNQKFNLV